MENDGIMSKRLRISLAVIAAMVAATIVLTFTGHLRIWYRLAWEVFSSRDELRTYVTSWGTYAPVVFIAIQAFQVVFAPIPGEVTGAVGGFIFGAWPNVVYSSVGLTLGSVVAFIFARIVGQPLVETMVGARSLEKFHYLTHKHGAVFALILFTIPGFPKDILCYILGLSPMQFAPFVIACLVGRIPGTIMLSLSGEAVYDENWTTLAIVSVTCVVFIGVVLFNRDKIEAWLKARRW